MLMGFPCQLKSFFIEWVDEYYFVRYLKKGVKSFGMCEWRYSLLFLYIIISIRIVSLYLVKIYIICLHACLFKEYNNYVQYMSQSFLL